MDILNLIKKNLEIKKVTRIHIITASTSLLLLALLLNSCSQKTPQKTGVRKVQEQDISTFIPYGHTLIPLNFINSESLSAVLSDYAYSNIYLVDSITKKKKLLGRNIKLLRSPKKPENLAILVPEIQAKKFINPEYSLYAVIQSYKNKNQPLKTKRKVLYLED